jgi:hypothetical protein
MTINAYNHLYEEVEMWLYHTNVLRTKHGYTSWVTLRSLVDQLKHIHATIDVKYLPTIVEEGVCFQTMGVQCFTQYCNISMGSVEPTGGYFYSDFPSKIHREIIHLVGREYNVDDIRQRIAREYRVIVPPDFLILHYKNVKKFCKNLQWLDDNCSCSTWLTRDCYCRCKNVRIHFLKLYIENVMDVLKV